MEPYRADRVVRVLTGFVSVLYYLAWLTLLAVLLLTPVMALLGREYETVPVPVRVDTPEGTLVSDWDPTAQGFELDEVNGELDVPMGVAPVWLRLVSWLSLVTLAVLAV